MKIIKWRRGEKIEKGQTWVSGCGRWSVLPRFGTEATNRYPHQKTVKVWDLYDNDSFVNTFDTLGDAKDQARRVAARAVPDPEDK